jgi:outer membrane protein OmpA-like peptidoglycan-associated protein
MKTTLYIIFFLLFCLTTEAQNFCKKTSIYFDLNKSDLTVQANAKIDSLLNVLNGTSYFIELYGYADS